MELTILETIIGFAILIFSIIIHEISHGSMAYYLGDNTSKDQGRLNLNPLNHLDFIGTIMLPAFLLLAASPVVVGWAKPVPVNFSNIRDKRWGALKVSLAGPVANFIVAIIFALIIRFIPALSSDLYLVFKLVVIYNLVLAIFNLIPIPPLDGSHILFDLLPQEQWFYKAREILTKYGFLILIFCIFIYPGINWIFVLAEKIFFFFSGQLFI
ncbi:MAG: site-2 protease family protein [Candidatus Paceibacterota bacterium]|jgi:Zn-dependent protease